MVEPVVAAAGIGAVTDLAGGLVDQYFNQKAADKSYKFQKKVLQNQVQWRVADAVKAGLHPLAALGVNPASGPSSMIGSSLGSSISNMGQNISRAAEAYLTPQDKIAARSALLNLEQQQANIDLTRSQIAGAQKALLTQGATPGVASRLPSPPASLPIPGTTSRLNVKYPNLGSDAEAHYGDAADIIGLSALVNDMATQMGLNPADIPIPNPRNARGYYGLSSSGRPFTGGPPSRTYIGR